MLGNLKISTKVVAGFAVMLSILAILGTIGYVMFGSVQTNVTGLAEHSLGAVKNSTGVERAAFETIMEEKNYLLLKKDEIHERAKKKLAELAGSLDKVDTIAAKFSDAELSKKSKDVRDLATQYGKLYDDGVASLKNNKAGEGTMDAKGTLVRQRGRRYMAAKKAEYLEAKTALAIVNRIESPWHWQTRYDRQKAYMVHKDQKYLRHHREEHCRDPDRTIRPSWRRCIRTRQSRNRSPTPARRPSDYVDAAKQWVAEQKSNAKSGQIGRPGQDDGRDGGDAVGKAADDYLAAKEAKVNKMAEAVFIVADIANEANTTRLNEKGYILTQDQKYWTGLNEHIAKLSKLYEDLRKVSLTAEDQQRIERADKATQEYLVAAKSWVENDTKLNTTILPEMKKGGETVLATAQTAENDAWKSSDDAGATVLGIVGTSKIDHHHYPDRGRDRRPHARFLHLQEHLEGARRPDRRGQSALPRRPSRATPDPRQPGTGDPRVPPHRRRRQYHAGRRHRTR